MFTDDFPGEWGRPEEGWSICTSLFLIWNPSVGTNSGVKKITWRRDVFPSQLIYSLYINHPNKKRASCVLHCKELKLMSIQCIFSYTNQEVVQNIYRGRKAGQTGVIVQMKNAHLWSNAGREAPMAPLTNTQPHTVNMFNLLKGKHNSVGFFWQGDAIFGLCTEGEVITSHTSVFYVCSMSEGELRSAGQISPSRETR